MAINSHKTEPSQHHLYSYTSSVQLTNMYVVQSHDELDILYITHYCRKYSYRHHPIDSC